MAGADLGILVKCADVLERPKTIDIVVFDKTVTMTLGRVWLTDPVRTAATTRTSCCGTRPVVEGVPNTSSARPSSPARRSGLSACRARRKEGRTVVNAGWDGDVPAFSGPSTP
ncbi:hypothetical protein [Amycolatopsis thermophila]|uniref:Uncharacterized protein n=1 Tax=Amycolatopsis thermophila TaxID=206084 RepID=A0ABU0F1I1_9PSEU|nr:hypothetical protein [Amycolatopsis thermophila]MDQ0381437.1 hypothetical protein [Amycolatopsis thermophila]